MADKKSKTRKKARPKAPASPPLPSIFDLVPDEQGGPIARGGFTYQDFVAVLFLLAMLEDDTLKEVWYETHDDITLIWRIDGEIVPEFVQVKAVDNDRLWNIALLCSGESAGKGKGQKPASSLLEKSLGRAKCRENPRFRLVTSHGIKSELRLLSYCRGSDGRDPSSSDFAKMVTALSSKLPEFKPTGDRDVPYWASNALWEVHSSTEAIRAQCIVAIARNAEMSGSPLFSDQSDKAMNELLRIAKIAGDARWTPDPNQSKFRRDSFREMWKGLLADIARGLPAVAATNLTAKMSEADLDTTQIEAAKELRRRYAQAMRRSTYMDVDNHAEIPNLVLTEMSSLYSKLVSDEIEADGRQFHQLCLSKLEDLDNALLGNPHWRHSFLHGAMYDITDRCLHRFSKRAVK